MIPSDYQTISEIEALKLGFNHQLTDAYEPYEYWMLDKVMLDMNRGGLPFALVVKNREKYPDRICVFRKLESAQPKRPTPEPASQPQ